MSGDIKLIRSLEADANEVVPELKSVGSLVSPAQQGVMGGDSVACIRDTETLAMLQVIKMGRRDIDAGNTVSIEEAVFRVRKQLNLGLLAE